MIIGSRTLLKSTDEDTLSDRQDQKQVITESAALDQGLRDVIACFMPGWGTF